MYDEKELLSYEGIIENCKRNRKYTIFVIAFIFFIMILVGINKKCIIACLISAGVFSVFWFIYMIHESIEEICINDNRLVIKDDTIIRLKVISKHEYDIHIAVLQNSGEIAVNDTEYKDLQTDDRVYVFEYLNKKGKCLLKDMYPCKNYMISPELYKFYIRDREAN